MRTEQVQATTVDAVVADLAQECAVQAASYVQTIRDIAAGENAAAAIPMGLLALSQVLVMGARLGAIEDVVPRDQFESDPGPDIDLEPLLDGLRTQFHGIDDYTDVVDPVTSTEVVPGVLSADLTEIAACLLHGLQHHEAGDDSEALWWWQFSYLSQWGARASMALRVLQSLLGHVRLDADDDVVAEAAFDALHP
ncbi:MAG: DUF5063 domain-containing protein [Dermatophilaceae bacterium]|nr:DUF5063 domain-containing protein [Intrasporangiaceae bacterium]